MSPSVNVAHSLVVAVDVEPVYLPTRGKPVPGVLLRGGSLTCLLDRLVGFGHEQVLDECLCSVGEVGSASSAELQVCLVEEFVGFLSVLVALHRVLCLVLDTESVSLFFDVVKHQTGFLLTGKVAGLDSKPSAVIWDCLGVVTGVGVLSVPAHDLDGLGSEPFQRLPVEMLLELGVSLHTTHRRVVSVSVTGFVDVSVVWCGSVTIIPITLHIVRYIYKSV